VCGIVVCNLFPCHDFMGSRKGLSNRIADQHWHAIVPNVCSLLLGKLHGWLSLEDPCWHVTLVVFKNPPRSIPSAATCVARRVDRAERVGDTTPPPMHAMYLNQHYYYCPLAALAPT
jgi:hypothetical protein